MTVEQPKWISQRLRNCFTTINDSMVLSHLLHTDRSGSDHPSCRTLCTLWKCCTENDCKCKSHHHVARCYRNRCTLRCKYVTTKMISVRCRRILWLYTIQE